MERGQVNGGGWESSLILFFARNSWPTFAVWTVTLSQWRNYSPFAVSGLSFLKFFRKVLRALMM